MGKLPTSPLPYRGSPSLQSGGQNQKWPTSGQIGYLTPAVSGIPTAAERGAKSEVAHKWANWLPHPCRIGEPHRCRAGGKIRSGPQVGKLGTSPLPYRGSPPLQSGGQNQKWPTSGQIAYLTPAVSGITIASKRGAKSEVAHKWAIWLPHPCRIGDPHRCRAGGKIRSGPQVGKLATSPLPYRRAPPLQSGGQNRKWPTSGQIAYLTPAVSGIPIASKRGAKSEVAHKWANWLPHPCRIGDPHRFKAGGKIRSGPQVGKLPTSPLPYRGSPPLQSGGQNQKWPTSGQIGYLTPAVSGSPTAAERGAKSEVAHKWANWVPHPCRIGDPHRCRAGGKIRSGPRVGKLPTSPLPYRGSPSLQSGGQNQKWPTSGQIGYLTPAVSGIPTAAERGAKSEVAHKWANWLPHPCRIGEPHRCRAGGKIRSGPQVGKLPTSPLPYRGSPSLQSGGQNQKWPTSGQIGYLTPAVSGIPTAAERGAKSEVAHKWANWLPHPCRIGEPHRCRAGGKIRSGLKVGKLATSPLPYRGSPPLQSGGQNQKWPTSGQIAYLTPAVSGIPIASKRGAKSEVAHKWANWLPHPCRIGDPHRCRAGGKIRSGPQVGKLATPPLPYRGAPPLQSGGQNQKWPTSGQIGYLTPAVSGIPTAAERGAKSEVAHKWANCLPHPCRIGDPHRFKAGGKIRSGPQVGNLATSPLPYRGSPPLQSGGQNQKWPTSGQIGYLTPAVSKSPTAAERGAKSEVAHKWANCLPHPCRIGDPHRFKAGGKIRSGPQVGKLPTSPLPYRGAPPLQSGGQNQKWPTSGQIGYLTPAVSGSPTAAERGAKSEVAHKWANWVPHPCRIGDPHRCRAGGKIRSGPQVGKLPTSPLPYRGSPSLQSGGQNQKWPTSGQIGYLTPAVSGIPNAAERGAKSEVAHKGANWLPHPCRIGEPHRCRAGGKIRSGPQVGKLPTSPLPYRGSPSLQSGGQNQKWPTSGQIGYLTPAVSGIPTAAERGAKSEVAHKWANWLPHPCRIGEPHRCRAGGKIRSGPQVGKLATSPLPYRGAPPLQSGGQNQKWPTKGQIGYLTPAVSGIPTAAERGAKSEVAHKWANWLPHPCRIGEPHRCRAGGKIRSGPQVGKLPTSPLPYRGSPSLQSGGQNQKWPTSGQIGYLTPAVSGIPTAAERGAKSEVAHKWANWLPHPCRIGEPHRCRAGGKIRSGLKVGKLATSPLPYRGSPPLQSGGQNQKWPTSGQIAYLTPAVSGIPIASKRGAKSEVAHKWANWLPHPCRIGDPHRCRAGGKIRSGPQVGKLATPPLPYRGAPPLQSGGQNQKWPTSGQIGYLTPAVSGIPTAAERGAKSEVAHKWANCLPHPCRIGDPHRFKAGGKIRSGPQVGNLATSPLPYRGSPPLQSGGQNQKLPTSGQIGYLTPCRIEEPHRCRAGGKIRSGPQVGKLPTSPLPYRGSPSLQSGGQNQKWPTSGQIAYLTPAVSGIPTAAERGAKSEVAHKWANWLPHPCRIGEPHRCRAGGKIRSGPQVGKLPTSPLPYRGSPSLQSGGQNQKWPTSGQIGYLTPAVSGIPTAAERGAKSEVAHKWANWLPHPCRIGDPHRCRAGGKIRSGPQVGKLATSPLPYRGAPPLQSGGQNQKWPTSGQIAYLTPAVSGIPIASKRGAKSEVAHKWANWLPHPCRIGDPHRCRAGGKIRSGPQVGKLATSPLPYRGAPPLQSGGQNQKWPKSGQIGYLTPAVSGIPTAAERGAKSEVAHKWANCLPHPCRIGDPHRFKAGGKISSGPQVGKLATSPLPYRGSPPLQSGGQNQKWPTSGQIGYPTPAVSGSPTAAERGAKSEVAHKWANWVPHPCRIGDPHRCRAGGKIRSGPQVGKLPTSPLPYRGSPSLQSGGQNQKWPTSGQFGYLTPAVSGIPTAAERGAKSEVAHKWANWLPHPCRIEEPHRCRAGGKIRSGPQVGKLPTSPLPYRGSPSLQSGGQNQKWPTSGQIGYLTPAVSGIPNAAERGAKSEVAHKGANWLPHPCRIGEAHRCRAGGKIRSGPQVGKLPTSPLPYRGSPSLQSGGQNQKWPTSGQIGYLTPAVSGIPTAAERGAKSEVAHKWANWLPHPCRIGEPHRCRAGGKIRSGPQVGKLATSPLPYRGAPPLQSGGQNQKWPTKGQIGYLTPAVSGIPTAAERGAKSEVAHKWANWLPHPCRIGEPHRCRAGGKIRSGPQVGKLPTSPLPYRGSPSLQSGGQNQKWPTSGQIGYLTPAVSGIPTAAERGAKSEVAHKWANWLPHPCRIGEPHRCRAGGKIRSGLKVGKLATSPLPYRGSPPLQSGGQNQKWPTSGQIAYLTPAVSGIPIASKRGAKSEVAHKWANWLPHPCRIGDPHRCRAGGKIRSGPQVGKLATPPLPYRGAPPLQSGGQNQKWPTSGQIGYLTPAVSGIPTAAERGAKSEVAHKWANCLPRPCRIGDPHRFKAGGKIRSGPQVGNLATSPLPYRGSPPLQSGGQNQKLPTSGQIGYLTPCRIEEPHRCRAGGKIRSGPQVGKLPTSPLPYRGSPSLQSGGQNQKWPTSGQIAYLTPAVSGIPTAAERGAKSEVAHKWANWLPHPCRIGEPHRCRAGGKIRSGPQVGKLPTSPLPYRGSPSLQSGGQNQKWPTSGQIGYLTPAVSGSPTAAERGAKSEVAHKGANWLPHPCRIGDPHRCRAGGKIRSGPQRGKLATSPLPYRGAPPLQSGGQNQKWPTSGQIAYLTPAVSGIPIASKRGAKSEVAHKWANWLPHPCRIGDPHRCRAGGKIRSGPQVGKLATSPLPYRGAPPLQSGGQNQKWPTSGQIGYLTPAVSGSPTAAERGAKS